MKYKILFSVLTITIIIWACGNQTNSETDTKTVVQETAEDYIKDIMNIWPGVYHNNKQISEREKAGDAILRKDGEDNGGWLNVHSHYIPINKPAIGDNLLYVEEYRDGDPSIAYRQRIYKLEVDSTGVGRVIMCTFKDKKKYLGAYKNMSMLDSLTIEDIGPYPPICDLIITKEDGKYHLKMNGKDCAFGDRYFNYQVILNDNDVFSYRDKIVKIENDSTMFTAADFQWHNLDKIEDR